MNYFFMMAGKGTRLHPLTLQQPKSLFKLDDNVTIFKRMTDLICKYDPDAHIYAVIGYMADAIRSSIQNEKITFVYNPFYAVTNSIASLWFAKEFITEVDSVLINGDIVMSEKTVKELLCAKPEKTSVLLDSSIKTDGDYNVEVDQDKVLVMSKQLTKYYGEYVGVIKVAKNDIGTVVAELDKMITDGCYDQWYENLFDQLIFEKNYSLGYTDVSDYAWTEVDCVDDLIYARKIYASDRRLKGDAQ